jgi:EAL domain-containing protein (putative c-di-GMP-specific phosphodiesterase class I)/DNA-binding NarL/FixJ family response regulator
MLDQSLPQGPDTPEPPNPRLLVLDDDAATGRLLDRIARAAGFSVIVTADVPAFRSAYRAAVPDVILLDLQLGDTDGVEQLRHLAAQSYRNSLVLISGFDSRVLATTRDLAAGLGLHVAATHGKPIDVPELRLTLMRLRAQTITLSVERLLQGLQDGEMVLEYQPIVRPRTRALGRLEALMRWRHPDLGRLEPARFLPLLEGRPDAVQALTDWVIAAAARDYQNLRELGVTAPVAVNVSPACLLDRGFPDRLERLLVRGNMPPQQLCLEIIEIAACHDPIQTADTLARLRLKGIELTVDDFGTGYSSLKLLRQMPFSAIKIDRSFVIDMLESRDSAIIVRSIIDLARNMDMDSIAEGVESEAAATLLESLGVGFLQGYLIARPMPIDQLPVWLGALPRPDIETQPPAPRGAPEDGDVDHATSDSTAPDEGAPVQPSTSRLARLTPRQQAVMGLVAEGYSIKQMARQLHLGVGTIKTHLSQAYLALGAHNRIDALRRVGLVPVSPGPGTDEGEAALGLANHA